eukprot:NODE_7962_length_1534_cov_9.641080.p2 GENE.NODE_7962_length_1534_cov_9.641080~~NODE_7962_length_1534_cov_9.641080.p2  ORF type:complete len:248 (+),score=81.59 NODE_7962_length_1534_cov_9.641080:96-839(+)
MATNYKAGHMVPASYAKLCDSLKRSAAAKRAENADREAEGQRKRKELRLRTVEYKKEYHSEAKKLIELRRQAKKEGNYFVEPEAKLLFVMRIVGVNKIPPKPRKILQLLRLRQLHNGVFLKVTKPITNMLKCVQPYVTYGYPTLGTIRKLVYKRGFGKVNKNRTRLISNRIVSDNLGDIDIHGVEDIIHELQTTGPNFKRVNNFLWPFKLSCPRGGFKCKRHGFNEAKAGDWGNRQELINELVARMN